MSRTMDGLIERYKSASGEGMSADGSGDQRMVSLFSSFLIASLITMYQVYSHVRFTSGVIGPHVSDTSIIQHTLAKV
jgi:hypothetical protein